MSDIKEIKLNKYELWDLIIALDYRAGKMITSDFNRSYIVSHNTPYMICDVTSPLRKSIEEEKDRIQELKHKLMILSGAKTGRCIGSGEGSDARIEVVFDEESVDE